MLCYEGENKGKAFCFWPQKHSNACFVFTSIPAFVLCFINEKQSTGCTEQSKEIRENESVEIEKRRENWEPNKKRVDTYYHAFYRSS